MKMMIERSALLDPLQMISGIVERRQTKPILANVLLTVKTDPLSSQHQLCLTATDLEIELISTIPLKEVTEPCSMTVSARKLTDICRSLPADAMLKLSLEGEKLFVSSGQSRFTLTTLPASDFPDIQQPRFTTEFQFGQSGLRDLFSKIHFAMGHQDVRYYLNGIFMNIQQGTIKCVATDGHRLAFSAMTHEALNNITAQAILPRKSVLELMRLLDLKDTKNSIQIAIGESHFRVVTSNFIFTSKLINAEYPDYEKLIPRKIEHTVTINRDALKQAFSRASILLNEQFRGVCLHLNQERLRIEGNNPEQEQTEELVHWDYQGPEVEVGFNIAYLMDAISALTSEFICWSFGDPNGGVLIEAPEKNNSFYVVMPLRL